MKDTRLNPSPLHPLGESHKPVTFIPLSTRLTLLNLLVSYWEGGREKEEDGQAGEATA